MKNTTQHRSPKQPRPLVLALMLTGALFLEGNPKVTNPAFAVPDPFVFAKEILHFPRAIFSDRLQRNNLPPKVDEAVRRNLSPK